VNRHGDIGIDILDRQHWSPALTITKVLLSIQSLLTDPFTDVCMEPEIGSLYCKQLKLYNAVARRWTWKYAMPREMSKSQSKNSKRKANSP